MKRTCLIIKSSSDYGSPFNRHICIDLQNQNDIYKNIESKRKKFSEIVERLLTQHNIYYDHYRKEKINEKAKNIAAIRFLDIDNTRIYCKEVALEGEMLIICAIAHPKRSQKNDKKINSIINSIVNYEYEVIAAD